LENLKLFIKMQNKRKQDASHEGTVEGDEEEANIAE
jgi:hypothetical protein